MSNGGNRTIILEYLKDTVLAKITVANGYNVTLKTKERGLRHPQDMNTPDYPAIFIASADEELVEITNRHSKSRMQVHFHCFVNVQQNTRVQLELDKIIEDLRRAIYEGPSVGGSDPTQGGRVLWSKCLSIFTDQGDRAPIAEAAVTFEFEYVSPGTNP